MSTRLKVFTILSSVAASILASVLTTVLVLGRPALAQTPPEPVTQPVTQTLPRPATQTLEPHILPTSGAIAQTKADSRLEALERAVAVDQSGNLTIRANNISIESSQDLTLKGGANATMKGAASLNLSSVSTTLKGDASTAIRGGIVTIN